MRPLWRDPWFLIIVLPFVVIIVGFGVQLWRDPYRYDESRWPCERFGDRHIEDVPARCVEHFQKRPCQ